MRSFLELVQSPLVGDEAFKPFKIETSPVLKVQAHIGWWLRIFHKPFPSPASSKAVSGKGPWARLSCDPARSSPWLASISPQRLKVCGSVLVLLLPGEKAASGGQVTWRPLTRVTHPAGQYVLSTPGAQLWPGQRSVRRSAFQLLVVSAP